MLLNEIPVANALELIKHLSPLNSMWEDKPLEWVFRGQANAEWELLPNAFRKNSIEKYVAKRFVVKPIGSRTYREQIMHEYALIKRSYYIADRAGLSVPDDSLAIREECLRTSIENFPSGHTSALHWPSSKLTSAIANAQHHGIPTRLLDWSHNPMVAAYFSAKEAAGWLHNNSVPSGVNALSVWAFNFQSLYRDIGNSDRDRRRPPKSILVTVSAPYASNPNLRAQAGMFTLERMLSPEQLNEVFHPRPFKDVLAHQYELTGSRERPERLYKLILPLEEAPELLRLLHLHRIDAAAVFPGMDGVNSAMQERRLYQ